MTIQSVPSHTKVHQAPTVAGRIAVPAVFESIGLTLLDALMTVKAARFFSMISRPALVAAVGKVTVIDALPLHINQFS